ncbi:MAG: TauD/TfdA family dioxygenase, partial [Gammaproteobacteria bacterium]|nr:TauD/TfdA family dioxygenase [Gammaproteobacteria bacterium]
MLIQPFNEPPFGATITDFDCAIPNKNAADEIRLALHHHQLMVIPNQQHLTPQQEVAFYRSVDISGLTVWRDQTNNPWEVFKIAQGNKAGTYQIPEEPGVLVLGKGEIDHYGLKVTLGGDRDAYGK